MQKISRKNGTVIALISVLTAVLVVLSILVQGRLSGTAVAGKLSLANKQHLAERLGGSEPDQNSAQNKNAQEGTPTSYEQQQAQMRTYPATTIPANGYQSAEQQYNLVTNNSASLGWQQVGPLSAPGAGRFDPLTLKATNISGRVTAITPVPSSCTVGGCKVMYLGTASGGLWKTTNGGVSWTPLSDNQLNSSVSEVVLDPNNSNLVYVGTGENNFCGGCKRGIGILKWNDATKTWTNIGRSYFVNRSLSALAIDPSNSNVMYAGLGSGQTGGGPTAGEDTAPGRPVRGVYKTTNGGQTWTNTTLSVFPGPSGLTPLSIIIDPANHNEIFAAVQSRGIYVTTDGGATWNLAGTGQPSSGIRANSTRVILAQAPSDHNVLYAAYGTGNKMYLYKSIDNGGTWTSLPNTPNACQTQCFYDMPVTVSPTDPNTLYIGGQYNYSYEGNPTGPCATFYPFPVNCGAAIMKSTDGGATWRDVDQDSVNGPIHPDDHAITFNPADPNTVYTGNDGGIFRTTNGGSSWNSLNNGIDTFQFTGIAVGPTGDIYGGTQDNGTFKITPYTSGTAVHVNGGDGGPAATDPSNPLTAYYTYYGSSLLKDINTAENQNGQHSLSNDVMWVSPFYHDAGLFYQPRVVDPVAGHTNTIFAGTNRIIRSLIGGGTDGNNDGDTTNDPSDAPNAWAPISPAHLGNPYCGNVSAMDVSTANAATMVAATDRGCIFKTTNALDPVVTSGNCDSRTVGGFWTNCKYVSGITWTEIDAPTPCRAVSSVKFAPGSATTIYAVYSGFNVNDGCGVSGHIWTTTDQGNTWTAIDGKSGTTLSLPDLPYGAIVINPKNNHLYVSGDIGVFASFDNGATWRRVDMGLPNAPVSDLQYNAHLNKLVAGVYGRGIWMGGAL